MAVRLCWLGFNPCSSAEKRVTANKYKVLLTDHLYPMMKHSYPDGKSGLFKHKKYFDSQEHMDTVRIKTYKSYALAFTVTRA